jgi:long-chain acyl-CoA synthetase
MALTTLAEVVESFEAHGKRDAIIAFQRDGMIRVSFAELGSRIDHMASGLMTAGVAKGDRVAVLAPNQVNWVVAALAAIRTGATLVPIDAQLPDEALAHVLRDAEPRVLCTVTAQADRLRKSGAAPHTIVLLDEVESQKSSGRARGAAEKGGGSPRLDAGDAALLFYTSGTTGPPKGVPLTHRNMVHQLNVLTEIGLVNHQDRLFLPLPLHHVYPFVMGMLLPLALGAPIVMPGGLTGPQLTHAAREGRVTVIVGVPRLYGALLDGVRREAAGAGKVPAALLKGALGLSTFIRRTCRLRIGRYLLGSVGRRIGPRIRLVASGGAALDPHDAYQLESLGWAVATGYGLSETSPLLTMNYPGSSRLTSAGRPIPGVELRIDPAAPPGGESEDEHPTTKKHGEGEVVVRGPNVFAGYLNLPDKTREVFTSDGWFRTGDLGSIDRRGFLHLTGRASTMIVTQGGKHVQPDDVEETYRKHPAIREIGILQKDGRLVALVVPARAGSEGKGKADDAAIRQALDAQGRRLRPFERVADFAITTDPLPKTRMGKVQRHELLERFDRAKSGKGESKKSGPMPSREMSGEDQELLRDPGAAAVWEWLAERSPRAHLTPDSSLRMDLDVDSMEWLNLTLEVGRRAGVELGEEAIGRVETVRDLLQEVAAAAKGSGRDGSQLDEALDEPRKVLSDDQRRWLRPLNPVQTVLARALYSVNRLLMRACFRVRAEGLEHLPAHGNYVIAPNHASYLDPFAIAAALDHARLRKLCWAGWTGAAFRGPLTRAASRLGRAVPIDPDRAVISSLALAAAVLKRGDCLVWFPEGSRSADGALQALRPGIGILLEHHAAMVVPTHIEGAHEALPVGSFLPRPHRIRVTFGQAVSSEDLEREGKAGQPSERITSGLEKRLRKLARQARPHGSSRIRRN